MPRYEFSEGTSNKFWQIDLNGTSFTTTFGRIGTSGQTSTKSFDTAAKAQAEYNKLVAEKTKKGYQLVSGGGAPAAPAPAVAPVSPKPRAAAPPVASAPTPTPPVVASPPAPTPSGGSGPSVVITEVAARAAAKELSAHTVKPIKPGNAAELFRTAVHEPFVAHGKNAVVNGAARGDAESQRLSREVLAQYGGAPTMLAKLDVDTAAAALQLVQLTSARENGTTDGLVAFWVAHSGLSFALDAFVMSLWDRRLAFDGWRENFAVWLQDDSVRTLGSLFTYGSHRALHASWLGATDEQRAVAGAHAEKLRENGSLLVRSAISSCVLDPAWIDADLREHARTGERAMFSADALLRASSPADVATYFEKLSDADHVYYLAAPRWSHNYDGHDSIDGYAFVQQFGLNGIDVACARIRALLPGFATGTRNAAAVRELLEVAKLAREYEPVVAVAMAVLEKAGDAKLSKDEDPRPFASDCLRYSPTIALPLVREVSKRTWAKNMLPQLERLAAGGASDDRPDADLSVLPEAMRTGNFKAPDFWQPNALPRMALRDGTLFPTSALDGLGIALKNENRAAIAELREIADPASLAAFGWELFQAWLGSGAPSKEKWAFTALGLLGTDDTARRLTPLIRAWPGESQHARAVTGLDVLGAIGSDVALMMLNGIAQKLKFKGLQERARLKMDEIAAHRGMTAEQLADRLVPDLDLEDDGSKTLDFGPRSFRVGFDEALSPFVVDATGTRLKDLPKPNSKDDPTLGSDATEVWKAMKKDVRALASIQLLRLELAMGNARRWSGEEFRNFFVEHPLLTHLVRRLVWGVYDGASGRLVRTFRVAEDRSYADQSDDGCEVDGAATIGIVHRLHLSDEDASAWGTVFADYELAQPFEQLARATYRLAANEHTEKAITRFDGRVVETKKLLGLLSRGWRKGEAQDAGCIFEVYKPISPQVIASLPFEMGLNAGGMDYVDPTQKLGAVDFAPSLSGWGGARTDAVAVTSLDEVLVSEVIRDIESIGQVTAS